MLRSFAIATILTCLAPCVWAQTLPAQGPGAVQKASPISKQPARKSTPKTRTATQPLEPTDKGPCQIGVIPAFEGDTFAVQTIGLTVFGNDLKHVPIEAWGLDDLAIARVRAAAHGATVRRIPYTKSTFASYYDPSPKLFGPARPDLNTIVRQIAANAGCAHYVVITAYAGQYGNTNQTLHGMGVGRGTTFLTPNSFVFANVDVKVFDGHSFAIEKNPADSFGARFAASLTGADTSITIKSPVPEPETEVVSSALFRDAARTLLARRLDKTLTAFFNQEDAPRQ